MGKHEKNRNHNDRSKVIIMITALLQLIVSIIDIIDRLLE